MIQRWDRDPLVQLLLCSGTLEHVEEEDERELESEYEVKEVCLTPPLSPTSESTSSSSINSQSLSPQPSSPTSLEFPEDTRRLDEDFPDSSALSLVDQDIEEENDEELQQLQPQPLLQCNAFAPWMCVFDLDDENDTADPQLREGGASPSSPAKQPLHLEPQPPAETQSSLSTQNDSDANPRRCGASASNWLEDVHSGMMNQFFVCLDPSYGRVMTIDEERVVTDENDPPSPPNNHHLPPALLPRSIPISSSNNAPPCQYFTNFATEHNVEAIYLPVCLLHPDINRRIFRSWAFNLLMLGDRSNFGYFVDVLSLTPIYTSFLLTIHTQTEDSGAAAGNVGAQTRRRVAPQATASMSLTPDAAAALTKKVQPKPHSGVRHEESRAVTSADAQDIIQVKTPGADRSALKDLPALRDAPPTKREELFVMKLKLCSVIFSFDDPTADKRGKDMKRQTLLELVDYVNTPAGQKIFSESVMGDLMAMVSANVCRALPPATDDFDPEEDEPVLEPAWPHLQVAYEFFLRFIVSSEVNAKAAKKYVDQKFCLQLVELFDSEDPRERDYLKTILHRIYGKFMSHRSFIRRAISNVFYRFVYETERHNGIGELLEILGSIINGFAIPLKKEHLQFLVRALIPLHKPKCVALYHQQLSYCIIQYVEKDADTATPILNGFFKCWPWSCSGKQVMFLNELEEILELLGADQLSQVSTMLFTNLARCLDSDHFQVVERALFLWNNEHLVNSGCLSRLNAHTVLPIIYGPLYKNSSGHWNATVEGLAQNVLKMYMEYDLALYDKCTAAYFREEEEAKKRLEALSSKWNEIEQAAMQQNPLAAK